MDKILAIILVLFGLAAAAPKPLDFDEIGRKMKEFGEKAMPIMKGTCKVVNDLSAISDQYQGRTIQQAPRTFPNQLMPQYPQFNVQYPQWNYQFPQYNPNVPQFNPLLPQFNPQNSQRNPLFPQLPPFPTIQNTQTSAQSPAIDLRVPKVSTIAPVIPAIAPVNTVSSSTEQGDSSAMDPELDIKVPNDISMPSGFQEIVSREGTLTVDEDDTLASER